MPVIADPARIEGEGKTGTRLFQRRRRDRYETSPSIGSEETTIGKETGKR
jgi:hypothetical protein